MVLLISSIKSCIVLGDKVLIFLYIHDFSKIDINLYAKMHELKQVSATCIINSAGAVMNLLVPREIWAFLL